MVRSFKSASCITFWQVATFEPLSLGAAHHITQRGVDQQQAFSRMLCRKADSL
jgi:hypothetical protein